MVPRSCVHAPFPSESITFLAFTPLLLPSCLSDFVVRFGRCLTLAVWKTYRPLGSRSLPSIFSLDWAMLGCRPSPSCLAYLLSYNCGLFGWGSFHAIALLLLYHYLSFISLLPMGLWAYVSAVPVHFPQPYLFWALLANIPTVPAHLILRVFSAHLLLLLPWAFANSFGLGPITTSLLLITFQAYWPLSQPNEFINSFLGLPWPIYFFFTSYCSHEFTTSLLGFSRPFISSLPLIILVGLLTIIPTILSCWACFTIFFSHFLHIVGLLLLLGPLSKSGYQQVVSSIS